MSENHTSISEKQATPRGFMQAMFSRYGEAIRQEIEGETYAKRFFWRLVRKHNFRPEEIVCGLLRSAFHLKVGDVSRLRLLPELRESLEYPTPGEWIKTNRDPKTSVVEKARRLADIIEREESGTPEFGLDELDSMKAKTPLEREQAVNELNRLSTILRLYADYHEKSRQSWRIMGRIESMARAKFQGAVRDDLQEQVKRRTGKYSDERYCRLLNIALRVIGGEEIDSKALVARRTRKTGSQLRFTPSRNR